MRAIFDGLDGETLQPSSSFHLKKLFACELPRRRRNRIFRIFIFYLVFIFRRQRDIIYYIKKAEKGRAKDTTTTTAADFLANNGNRSTRIQLLYGTPRPRTVLNLLETGQKAHCSVNLAGIIIVVDIIIVIGVILGVRVCAVHFDIVTINFKFEFNTYSAVFCS